MNVECFQIAYCMYISLLKNKDYNCEQIKAVQNIPLFAY